MTPRRWYTATVLTLLVAGGVIFFAASRTWLAATVTASSLPVDEIAVTGTDAHPLIPALGLVIAAAGLAVLATRGLLRQVVGLLAALAAASVVVTFAVGGSDRDSAFATAIKESTAFTGSNTPDSVLHLFWPGVTLVAAAVVVLFGLVTVLRSRQWPAMSGRYDAPGARRDDGPIDMWKALDEGDDPTE